MNFYKINVLSLIHCLWKINTLIPDIKICRKSFPLQQYVTSVAPYQYVTIQPMNGIAPWASDQLHVSPSPLVHHMSRNFIQQTYTVHVPREYQIKHKFLDFQVNNRNFLFFTVQN